MSYLSKIKADVRKAAFATRKAAFTRGQGQAAELLADYLAPYSGDVLGAYMPILSEANPLAEIGRAHV